MVSDFDYIISINYNKMMKASAIKIAATEGYWNTPPDGGFLFDFISPNTTPEQEDALDEAFA
jgi:hypothetical protein